MSGWGVITTIKHRNDRMYANWGRCYKRISSSAEKLRRSRDKPEVYNNRPLK